MEEKVLVKGKFSKANFISILFGTLSVGSVLYAFFFISDESDWPIWFVFAGVFILLSIFFKLLLSRCAITISNKRAYGKAAFGKMVDLPFDMISSVGTSFFNGISVATSSGRITFYLCKNRDEVYNVISKLLLERQNQQKSKESVIKQEIPQSNADELKKFKELLDSGIITQEEFDAKKKQLLGL